MSHAAEIIPQREVKIIAIKDFTKIKIDKIREYFIWKRYQNAYYGAMESITVEVEIFKGLQSEELRLLKAPLFLVLLIGVGSSNRGFDTS